MLMLFQLFVSSPKPFQPDQTFTSRPPGQPDNRLADTSVNKVNEKILEKENLNPRRRIYIQGSYVMASLTRHLYMISGWLPARWASGFSGDHQQDHQCLWLLLCYSFILSFIACILLGIKLLLLLLVDMKIQTGQKKRARAIISKLFNNVLFITTIV